MNTIKGIIVGIAGPALLAFLLGILSSAVHSQDKKEKDPNEGKMGKTIGTLTEKPANAIEVKADGEEKARRYVPQWVGNASGGPDKAVLKTFSQLKIGSRVEVEWVFEERFRALKVKVLALPKDAK